MKTVLYLDWKRNSRYYIRTFLIPVVLLMVLLLVTVLVDRVAPAVNSAYMGFPDMAKELMGLPSWNRTLYGNVWQVLALVYPFYVIYIVMTGLSESIISEERLETVVYMRNLSIGRPVLLGTKILVWLSWILALNVALILENALFFKLLKVDPLIRTSCLYYLECMGIALLYLSIAVFLSSFMKSEADCRDRIVSFLLYSLLIGRCYALFVFLEDLLISTGREGKVVDTVGMLGEKLKVLSLFSPSIWCWPAITTERVFVVCGVIVTVILAGMGFAIYTHEKVIFRER